MIDIKAWRLYLKIGNPNDGLDDELIYAIKTAESKLSNLIPSDNIIFQNNISPEEYHKSLLLVEAQATMDAMGPAPTRDELPSATKFMVSDEESKLNSWDPNYTQQQGITSVQLPKNENLEKSPENLDDRMLAILDLIQESEER